MRSANFTAKSRAATSAHAALLIASLVASIGVRVLTLRTIDLGGDATFKWFFVKSLAYDNPWVFDHHTMRLSIIVPIWIVQQIFGAHPHGMYLLPLLAAIAQVPLLYACGLLLGSAWYGVAACLLLLVFDPAADAASQLLPGIFQATYMLGALHSLLHVRLDPEPRRRWLVFTAAWLFAAYLAMVTTVYFFPGVALALWLARRRGSDIAIVFGILAALFAIETLGYAVFSPYPYGQFQLILHTHTDVKPTGFWGLFGRYAALPRAWQSALAAWLACAFAWLWLRRRAPLEGYARAEVLWLLPLSGLAGMTFGIKKLSPIIPATDFSVRYCDVLMPPLALGIGATLIVLARPWSVRFSTPRVRAVVGAAVIAGATWTAVALYRPEQSAWRVTNDQWRILNAAFEAGLPIVGSNRSDHFQNKTLTCLEWAFLEDKRLLSDGRLTLLKLGRTQVGARTHRYVSRDPLPPEVVAKAIKKHQCLVTVGRRDEEPKLALAAYPGPDCPSFPLDP